MCSLLFIMSIYDLSSEKKKTIKVDRSLNQIKPSRGSLLSLRQKIKIHLQPTWSLKAPCCLISAVTSARNAFPYPLLFTIHSSISSKMSSLTCPYPCTSLEQIEHFLHGDSYSILFSLPSQANLDTWLSPPSKLQIKTLSHSFHIPIDCVYNTCGTGEWISSETALVYHAT